MDEVFIDSDGKIKKSSMVDEHSLIKITEKTPELTNIGKIVRGDTNSNILTFEINRYYDGEDVYGKNIRFIIKNSLGIYTEEAVNLQYSDKHIRFSWILSYADTHSGTVTAAIEFYGKNDEGYPYSLKTTTFSFNPADTLDATDMVVDVPNWFVDVENRLTNLEENGGVADLSLYQKKEDKNLITNDKNIVNVINELWKQIPSDEVANIINKFSLDNNGDLLFDGSPIKSNSDVTINDSNIATDDDIENLFKEMN